MRKTTCIPLKDPSVQLPTSLSLLLRQEERWRTPSLPRLPLCQQTYHLQHLFPFPYFWSCWQTTRCQGLHQVWCSLGVQQCTNQRWPPMEGHLCHPQGIIWIHSHILWTYQLPHYFPTIHEQLLLRHDCWRMACHLHGWPPHLFPHTSLHEEPTKRILQCMTELDLHLKLEKCKFNTNEVEYLRMIVKPGQPAMDPVKLDGIASWPTPTKVKDIRSFLSFANFYQWFIPNYSNVTCPLIDLTKKNLI